MEHYSPDMEQAVAQQLRSASPEEFDLLRSYYERRGGPGLRLLREELEARGMTAPAIVRPMYPFKPSAPNT